MRVLELGHVTLLVNDLERAAGFYSGVLGISEVARAVLNGRRVAFFSFGLRHHDLALVEASGGMRQPADARPGLEHIGLKIGDSIDALRAARAHLLRHGIEAIAYRDHRVCKSIQVRDPDGIALELYADGDPALWAKDPTALAFSAPLKLD